MFVLALQGPMVTICTTMFNIHKFYVLPTQCIYVFCADLRTNSDYLTFTTSTGQTTTLQ
jgi:hypothetical protein